MIKVKNRSEKWATCMDYTNYLSEAVLMLRIDTEDARKMFGCYTYKDWDDFFSKDHVEVSEFYKKGWRFRSSAIDDYWSVDMKIDNSWIFVDKFSTKKDAIAYIKEHLNDSKSKFA